MKDHGKKLRRSSGKTEKDEHAWLANNAVKAEMSYKEGNKWFSTVTECMLWSHRTRFCKFKIISFYLYNFLLNNTSIENFSL
jgi:hypothetical protein